jgi:hypothetical protein
MRENNEKLGHIVRREGGKRDLREMNDRMMGVGGERVKRRSGTCIPTYSRA